MNLTKWSEDRKRGKTTEKNKLMNFGESLNIIPIFLKQ